MHLSKISPRTVILDISKFVRTLCFFNVFLSSFFLIWKTTNAGHIFITSIYSFNLSGLIITLWHKNILLNPYSKVWSSTTLRSSMISNHWNQLLLNTYNYFLCTLYIFEYIQQVFVW